VAEGQQGGAGHHGHSGDVRDLQRREGPQDGVGDARQGQGPAADPEDGLGRCFRLRRAARTAQLLGHEIGVAGEHQPDQDLHGPSRAVRADHSRAFGVAKGEGGAEYEGGQGDRPSEASGHD